MSGDICAALTPNSPAFVIEDVWPCVQPLSRSRPIAQLVIFISNSLRRSLRRGAVRPQSRRCRTDLSSATPRSSSRAAASGVCTGPAGDAVQPLSLFFALSPALPPAPPPPSATTLPSTPSLASLVDTSSAVLPASPPIGSGICVPGGAAPLTQPARGVQPGGCGQPPTFVSVASASGATHGPA